MPNHLAAHDANPWWWDVLRLGRGSRWRQVFDIDWDRARPATSLLPVLGDHYGRELEAGHARARAGRPAPIASSSSATTTATFPLRPEAEGAILAEVARQRRRRRARRGRPAAGPGRAARRPADDRDADLGVAERTALGRLADPAVAAALDDELAALHADPDRLDLVLEPPAPPAGPLDGRRRRARLPPLLRRRRARRPPGWRARTPSSCSTACPPSSWPTASSTGCGSTTSTAWPTRRPTSTALRELAGPDAWLVVEKILRRDEDAPAVAGRRHHRLRGRRPARRLAHRSGRCRRAARRGWRERGGRAAAYEEVALEARREVLRSGFAADLDRVVDALRAVCGPRRRHRDHARAALRAAVVEVAVHPPRYRTTSLAGATPGRAGLDRRPRRDRRRGRRGEGAAPDLDPELLDLLADVLAGRLDGRGRALVVTRFQQLTGPWPPRARRTPRSTAGCRCRTAARSAPTPAAPTATAEDWHAGVRSPRRRAGPSG